MLPVFICEHDQKQREYLESIVKNYAKAENYDLELVLSTGNPTELLNYIEKYSPQNAFYLLDVNLLHEMSGFTLATKIRDTDTFGKIVFITNHMELFYLTFQYKIEAMDYIIKDSSEDTTIRIQECIKIAYQRLQNNIFKREYYQVKVNNKIKNIPLEDIMFFMSHHTPHKLRLYTTNNFIEFYGSLRDFADISADFYRCHKSFVVNTKNIRSINKSTRTVEMINGEVAPVAFRKIKELQSRL